MQLRDYRARMGFTLADIGASVGLGEMQISRHERGVAFPSVEQIDAYEKATDGAVRYEDWRDLSKRTASPAASTEQQEPA